jgi:hemoglobin
MMMQIDQKISPEEISNLVDRFYEKVRLDPEIGPVFNEAVEDWPTHLRLLKDFWSTVLFTERLYKGDPLSTHLKLPLKPAHFERWLALFAETAHEVMPPEHAAIVIAKSQRIAENFKLAIAYQQGKVAPPLPERNV